MGVCITEHQRLQHAHSIAVSCSWLSLQDEPNLIAKEGRVQSGTNLPAQLDPQHLGLPQLQLPLRRLWVRDCPSVLGALLISERIKTKPQQQSLMM